MFKATVGHFTDVGTTHFLARCPGKIGLYLALTGIPVPYVRLTKNARNN